MEVKYDIEGGNFTKAGNASSAVKQILKQLNVDSKIIKRVVIAMYEAEVNVAAHAFSGIIKATIDPLKITILIEDMGPGIPDIDLAMQEGFTTASAKVREMGFGAGMGLPNMKRNADIMNISSIVGKGTTVELITNLSR